MDKIKFVGGVVFFVALAYVFITVLMPFISSTASDAADTINASAYASNYVAARAGTNYMPLVLYFVPGAIGVAAIVYKLKFSH